MKNNRLAASIFLTALCLISMRVPGTLAGDRVDKDVRPSILAGSWYPRSPEALTGTVRGFLSGTEVHPLEGDLKAIIVPHAGYIYSGAVAAHAYKLLENRPVDRVVLVGPSHRLGFQGISVNLQSAYETPLGRVPVDQQLARKILDQSSDARFIRKAHDAEHCLEIQLPFLQVVLSNFEIVPILMGRQDPKTCMDLAGVLASVMDRGGKTLLLASSDLSHYHPYDEAGKLDGRFIERVRGFDPEGLWEDLSAGKCEACGGGPVMAVLLAARKMGANRTRILKYANSGDVTGDHKRVVGYLSAAVIKSSDTGPNPKSD